MAQDAAGPGPLSVHRAFVVHFRMNSDVGRGEVRGRVEHVLSGRSAQFESLQELLAFIARVLARVRAPPRQRPGRGA